MVPDWLDANYVESLRWAILAVMVLLAIAVAVVAKLVRLIVVRLGLVGLLVALGLALWLQRAELRDCVSTCSCQIVGQSLEIPAELNPNCD